MPHRADKNWIGSGSPDLEAYAFASAFLGVVDFFGVAFFAGLFFGAPAFLGAVGAVCLVLVTRPDLVLVSTFGTSTTAGACNQVSIWSCLSVKEIHTALAGLAVFFALGLAVLAFGVAAAVFLVAGAFFVLAVLEELFFGAPFLVVADVVGVFCLGSLGSLASLVSLASLGSFYLVVSNMKDKKALITNLGGGSFGSRWLGFLFGELDWPGWTWKDTH